MIITLNDPNFHYNYEHPELPLNKNGSAFLCYIQYILILNYKFIMIRRQDYGGSRVSRFVLRNIARVEHYYKT